MVLERLYRPFIRFSFRIFEPLLPVFLTYFLDKRLKKWEVNGLIDRFIVKVVRPERYHYKINFDFFLSEEQARERFSDIMVKIPKFRR